MGMSASQARLLSLTSRLHDVELKAQHIQSQKIALATQKDAVYQEFYDALDAKALKVNLGINGETQLVDANFNSLCNYHKDVSKNYALMDNKTGKILVNEKTADIYKQYGSDKYAFAFAMMGVMPNDNDYSTLGSETDDPNWNGGNLSDNPSYNNGNNEPKGHYETRTIENPGETHTYTYYTGSISAEVYQEDHRNADQEVQGSRRTLSVDISLEDEMTSENACMQKFYDGFDSELIPDYGCDWCVDMGTLTKNLHTEVKTVQDQPSYRTEEVWVEDETESTDNSGDSWQDKLNNPDGDDGDTADSNKTYTIAMTKTEATIYNALVEAGGHEDLKSKFEAFNNATDPKEKKKAYEDFRQQLMNEAAEEIFKALACKCNKENAEWDKLEFDHYTQLWDAIEEAGGCTVIEPQYEGGELGTAWFKNAVESGNVTVRAFNESGHAKEWSDTSFATSTNSNYLQEVDDKTMEKKAEAKYEHELSIINAKDTKFDTELKNLETERTAITTEIDSIKKVEKDNIDRTFGIFS